MHLKSTNQSTALILRHAFDSAMTYFKDGTLFYLSVDAAGHALSAVFYCGVLLSALDPLCTIWLLRINEIKLLQ